MVAAGVFLVARLLPVFLRAPGVLDLAAVIAAITMLGAALAALAQEDLKRLLAYSTISQVAIMLAGLARHHPERGRPHPHLLSHAGFKALLFLVAGAFAYRSHTPWSPTSAVAGARAPWWPPASPRAGGVRRPAAPVRLLVQGGDPRCGGARDPARDGGWRGLCW